LYLPVDICIPKIETQLRRNLYEKANIESIRIRMNNACSN